MDFLQILLLLMTGLVVGFYSGIMGTGGNVILIPILDALLAARGVHNEELVKSVIAHSLMVTLFNGIFISYRQYRTNNFYPKEAIITAFLGVLTAFFTTHFITSGDWYDKKKFNIVFVTMLLLLVIKLFTDRKSGVIETKERSNTLLFLLTGGITGILTSLSGMGGGILLIPAFTDGMKMSIRKAASISISAIALLALPISLQYLTTKPPKNFPTLPLPIGYFSFGMILPILLGMFVAAPFGVKIAHKIHPLTLRFIFAGIIAVLCIKTIFDIITN
ncbi:MAG: sulfite exporter TauE/SafE family protein [Saprospiraceae bacterium]|nr:sulfite exporter TauE/SafE family protein [Saprospiraceae bacterium]